MELFRHPPWEHSPIHCAVDQCRMSQGLAWPHRRNIFLLPEFRELSQDVRSLAGKGGGCPQSCRLSLDEVLMSC